MRVPAAGYEDVLAASQVGARIFRISLVEQGPVTRLFCDLEVVQQRIDTKFGNARRKAIALSEDGAYRISQRVE